MNKPIRILHVLTKMNRSGAESMIMNYYRHIDRTKVQFDFIVHQPGKGDFDDEIIQMGGRIFELPKINFFKPWKYELELSKLLGKHKYFIIHSHLNASSSIILKVAKKNKVPVRISHSHANLNNITFKLLIKQQINSSEYLKKFIKNQLKKSIPKYATHFFSCGIEAGKWLYPSFLQSKVIYVNNAIDAELFSFSKPKSLMIKKELKIEGKFIIGHVGNFSVAKNYFFLLDIFNEIKKRKKESILILIGSGLLLNKVIDRVKNLNLSDSVMFLGKKKDIYNYLQAFDAFVFPSLYEGLPVTLIESQASGLKTIASTNIPSEVKITDLLLQLPIKESPDLWAEKIINFASNYKRKNMKEDIVKMQYDIHSNAKMLQEFYLNVNLHKEI